MKRLIVLIILLLSINGYAQNDEVYYKKQKSKDMFVSATMYRNLFGLVLKENGSKNTYFLPNQIANISLGVSHPKIPIDISVGVGIGKVSKNFPKTKSYDFLIHKYAHKFVVDAFLQYYKGFYIDQYNKLTLDSSLTYAERSFPNLEKMLLGVFGQYIFNGDKFSYQSAFDNREEVQLKSAGSFMAGASVYYFCLKSNKPVARDITRIKEWQFGVNGGYSYNFVLSKKWMLNVSASAGLDFNKKFKIRPTALIRASCFYTSGNWSVGAFAFTNILTVINENKLLGTLNSGSVNLKVIRRIEL